MKKEQIKQWIQNKEMITPCYVFNTDVLTTHVNRMKEIMGDSVGLVYAMKANPFLVPEFNCFVDKIEVCSPGELDVCKEYGIPGEHIIFSGVNKTKEDVEAAFTYGVAIITIESMKHYRLVVEYCKEHQCEADVLFRITSGSQFGMDKTAVEDIVKNCAEYPYIHIKGIHFFSGTQKKKIEKLTQELDELHEFMNRLETVYGLTDLSLEYGAGLAVPYFEGEDFEGLYANLEELVLYIKKIQPKYEVVLELGRYLAFACGTYVTTVEDVKCNNGHHYVLVDGGIHQLNYYGQNMAMRVPKIEVIEEGTDACAEVVTDTHETDSETVECTICGSLCTLADVLVRKWEGKLPKEGDVFLFKNAGSYSITEAPALFLSRKMPAVYGYCDAKGLDVLRRQQDSFVFNCKRKLEE